VGLLLANLFSKLALWFIPVILSFAILMDMHLAIFVLNLQLIFYPLYPSFVKLIFYPLKNVPDLTNVNQLRGYLMDMKRDYHEDVELFKSGTILAWSIVLLILLFTLPIYLPSYNI
jgi:hypothetical protein